MEGYFSDVETLVPYKYLELDQPEITAEVEEQEDAFVIHLKSSCFSPFTAIGFTDADMILEDNFFHMTGEKGKVYPGGEKGYPKWGNSGMRKR